MREGNQRDKSARNAGTPVDNSSQRGYQKQNFGPNFELNKESEM
jgi:hypothetical protein